MRNLTDNCSASAERHREQLRFLHLVSRWVGGPGDPPKQRGVREEPELRYDSTPAQDESLFLEQNDISKYVLLTVGALFFTVAYRLCPPILIVAVQRSDL
jgi:hypothetical protein